MGLPVIVCGATERIGAGVIEGLKPEYETIHFVTSPEAGKVQIPAILRGDVSLLSSNTLGSKNCTEKPIAVILGAAFDAEGVATMMEATKELHQMPWLRADKTVPMPPLGPAYGEAMVKRIKVKLAEMQESGTITVEEQKVIWF